MKTKLSKVETEALQLIKAHTGCKSQHAVALFADLSHLMDKAGGIQKFSSSSANDDGDTDDKLTFAIDYDDTWTAAPRLMADFVDELKDAGHKCVCITGREKDTDDKELENSIGKYMQIIYAKGKPKAQVARTEKITVDVWIDDNPESVIRKSNDHTAFSKTSTKTGRFF